MRSIRSRRSQPELRRRVGGDDDLVGPALGDGVHRRQERIGVADLAGRLDALGRDTADSARSTRTCADSRTASS